MSCELWTDTSLWSLAATLLHRYAHTSAMKVVNVSAMARPFVNLASLPAVIMADKKTSPSVSLVEPATVMRAVASCGAANSLLAGSSAEEIASIAQWLGFCSSLTAPQAPEAKLTELQNSLATRVFLVSNHVTMADLAVYVHLHPTMARLSDADKLRLCHVSRWFNHVQHLPGIFNALTELPALAFPQPALPSFIAEAKPAAAAAPKEKKEKKESAKKEKAPKQQNGDNNNKKAKTSEAAAPATGGATSEQPKKEKKETKKKEGKAAHGHASDANVVVGEIRASRMDFRVGVIKNVWKHPKADKLYCEEVDVGEPQLRQIASGLVPYIPIEQMMNRRVIVFANLPVRSLVGFPSHGMLLLASNPERTQFEFIEPPEAAKPGERVTFPGVSGEPDEVFDGNVFFKGFQPLLKTGDDLVAKFNGVPLTTSAGPVTVKSIKNGGIS